VLQPVGAQLRSQAGFDLVGVNSDGMVYALDGANGVALWIARFRPSARRGEAAGGQSGLPFTPLILRGPKGLANVVVAYDGGVRALDGATGRELWRAPLSDRPAAGTVIASGEQSLLAIVSNGSPSLTILNGATGQMAAQAKLEKQVIGPPSSFSFKEISGVVLALEDGKVETWNVKGERLNTIKMDTTMTTAPLFVSGPMGGLVVVGSESGLIALDAEELRPLGRVATEGDAPRGHLAAIDLEGDGAPEVVMLTRKGRVVVIKTSDGKIKWYTSGATDAASAAFADLNGDGVLDVIAASGSFFAQGFSGNNGSLIWRAEGDSTEGAATDSSNQLRALTVLTSGQTPVPFLVGSDVLRTGLRAVGLPTGSVKISER
jgi:outer membrane protein assembly factor BamB